MRKSLRLRRLSGLWGAHTLSVLGRRLSACRHVGSVVRSAASGSGCAIGSDVSESAGTEAVFGGDSEMRKFCAMLVCAAVVGVLGQSTQAAQLSMSGSVVTPVAESGMPFSFTLDYTGVAATSTAVTGGVLQVGSHVWNTVLGGTNPNISIVGNSLQIAVQFAGPSSLGAGTAVSFLSFTISGPAIGPNATEANINSIRNGVTAASGSLLVIPNAPFSGNNLVLQGTTVPEPATMGLLLALGAVVGGRRFLRRRSAVAC